MADSQVIELLGRNRLIDELLRAGLEVALPLRDRGIDLTAYAEIASHVTAFVGRPIQMKAASGQSFSIDLKYRAFPGLILAYVWNVQAANEAVTYGLAYGEALAVAEEMGYTKTSSWKGGCRYDCTRISKRLLDQLSPFRMTPQRWRDLVIGSQAASTAVTS